MGIKGLYAVLAKHAPNSLKTVRFDDLTGYRCAVDISIFLYKHVRTAGERGWLNIFVQFLCVLKSKSIKAICIFDGPDAPPEKYGEQIKRRETVAKAVQRMGEIESLIETLKSKYIPTGKSAIDLRDVVREYLRLRPEQDAINYKDPKLVCDMLMLKVQKYRKQTMPITSVYADLAKEIIECLGLAWYQATGEAEALCSYMAINGQVDGVLTEDTDVLAYGTPILFSKIDMRAGTVMMIEMKSMLREMEMDMLQFRDMCILLGCDYNRRAKLRPTGKAKGPIAIGPKKAIDLIRAHKTIDRMVPLMADPTVLNTKRCRELFSPPRSFSLEREPFNRPIDTKRTEEFLLRNDCSITIQYILEAWRPTDLVYLAPDNESAESGSDEAEGSDDDE